MAIKLYKVGGCVRDQLIGRRSKDTDYAVEAGSYGEMREYIASRGKIYLETPEYLTIRARVNEEDADFVLCRSDGVYYDGRRPTNVVVGSIDDDLARRDFTINAIAIDENGKLYDPFCGAKDIERRVIRCVGRAEDRFKEDYLRILRAIRFSIVLGFSLDTNVWNSLNNPTVTGNLEYVSPDRIKDELHKMLSVDCYRTLQVIAREFPHVSKVLFENSKVWLKPTLEERH